MCAAVFVACGRADQEVSMPRKIFKEESMRTLTPEGEKTWLRHIQFSNIPNFRFPFWEVVYRNNRQYISHKAAAIFLPEKIVRNVEAKGYCERELFFRTLKLAGIHDAKLYIQHALRPYTYFAWPDDGKKFGLTENWQLEIAGGQVEEEEGITAAIRELVEESGIGAEQVLCWTDAFPSPTANDAGTHLERYGLWYVLCSGDPHPPMDSKNPDRYREGIVGFDMVAISEIDSYLLGAAQRGIPIEIWVHLVAFGIKAGL